jgi:hypothetical protein
VTAVLCNCPRSASRRARFAGLPCLRCGLPIQAPARPVVGVTVILLAALVLGGGALALVVSGGADGATPGDRLASLVLGAVLGCVALWAFWRAVRP